MRPNIDQKFEDIGVETILFECECNGSHYLEVSHDKSDSEIRLEFNDVCPGLWRLLRQWWMYRRSYFSSVILNRDDIVALKKVLDKFLDEYKKED